MMAPVKNFSQTAFSDSENSNYGNEFFNRWVAGRLISTLKKIVFSIFILIYLNWFTGIYKCQQIKHPGQRKSNFLVMRLNLLLDEKILIAVIWFYSKLWENFRKCLKPRKSDSERTENQNFHRLAITCCLLE